MTTEIPFKQWRSEEAKRLGLTIGVFNNRLYGRSGGKRSKIQYPNVRRVNKRVVFVKVKL